MSGHAINAPSSAYQWRNCSAAPNAQAECPTGESAATREGEAGHWVFAETLTRGLDDCSQFVGQRAPNGVVVDQRMADGAQTIVDDILDVVEAVGCSTSDVIVEQPVYMTQIHPTRNWGTPDARLFVPDAARLYVWDYKAGFKSVSAENNDQLIDYVEGICESDGVPVQGTTGDLRIVQPFDFKSRGPVDKWIVPLVDLIPHWDDMRRATYESEQNPTHTPGPWCWGCSALVRCSAARKSQASLIEYAQTPYELDELDPHSLAVQYELMRYGKDVVSKRFEAIEDELTHRIEAGQGAGSGYVLESKQGREEYTRPDEQIAAVARMFGVDAFKKTMKTPNQLITSAPKDKQAALATAIKSMKQRKKSLTLTRATDSKISRAFQRKEG